MIFNKINTAILLFLAGFYFLLFVPIQANASTYDWTKIPTGGTDFDYGNDVAADSLGNAYYTGAFKGTINFNPEGTEDEHTSNGQNDVFISKYNSDGSYGWTKTFGSTGSDSGFNIEIDHNDNIYISGVFSGTVNFNPGGTADNKTAVGLATTFLTKYSSDGSYAWTKVVIGNNDLKIDSSGNLYLAESFTGTLNFNPGGTADNHTSNGSQDASITKYNSDGSYGWTKTFGGTLTEDGRSVAFDNADNIYFSGTFKGTVNFNPGGTSDNHTSNGMSDIFITKYNSSGNYIRTITYGDDRSDEDSGLAADLDGNVILSGYIETCEDPCTPEIYHEDGHWHQIGFLNKYDENGSIIWSKSYTDLYNNFIGPVTTDASGNIFLTGWYGDYYGAADQSIDLNPGGSPDIHTASGYGDAIIVKYANDGTYDWAYTIGGNTKNSLDNYDYVFPFGITTANDGSLYITGNITFSDGTGFVTDPDSVTHPITGVWPDPWFGDPFLTKITSASTVTVESASISALLTSNVFQADSPTDTDAIQVTIDVIINIPVISGSATNEIQLSEGTEITATDGSNLNPSLLQSSLPTLTHLTNIGDGLTSEGALQWGIPSLGLQFSNPVTLKIYVGTDLNGQTLNILRSVTGTSDWTNDGIVAPATCVVTDGYCQFQATKASYYVTVSGTLTSSNSNSNNNFTASNSSVDAPKCGDTKPYGIPDLFQINTKKDSAQLFFTPINNNNQYYMISFGFTPGDERFGVTVPAYYSTGVMDYTINYLHPNTFYYFKIRGGNGCMPGDWSQSIKVKTTGKQNAVQKFYKYTTKR